MAVWSQAHLFYCLQSCASTDLQEVAALGQLVHSRSAPLHQAGHLADTSANQAEYEGHVVLSCRGRVNDGRARCWQSDGALSLPPQPAGWV